MDVLANVSFWPVQTADMLRMDVLTKVSFWPVQTADMLRMDVLAKVSFWPVQTADSMKCLLLHVIISNQRVSRFHPRKQHPLCYSHLQHPQYACKHTQQTRHCDYIKHTQHLKFQRLWMFALRGSDTMF
jgi:hypothetical protein